jgi:lipopolysaccharide export system protein LptA
MIALVLLALAASPSPPPQMEIVAKTTTFDGKAHTYQVKGNVKVTLPNLVVTCAEATLFANAKDDAIVRVVFSGNVEAARDGNTFRADRITYHVLERRLEAVGTTRIRLKLPAKALGPVSGP